MKDVRDIPLEEYYPAELLVYALRWELRRNLPTLFFPGLTVRFDLNKALFFVQIQDIKISALPNETIGSVVDRMTVQLKFLFF